MADRSAERLLKDFKGMDISIKLINDIMAGTLFSDETIEDRQLFVDNNVEHLEFMKAKTDWGTEDMTATTNAINAGKGYTAS